MPLPDSMVSRRTQDNEIYKRNIPEENPLYLVNRARKNLSLVNNPNDPLAAKKSVVLNNLHEFLLKSNHSKSRTKSLSSSDTPASSLSSKESRNPRDEKNHMIQSPFQMRENNPRDSYTRFSEKENHRRNRSFTIDKKRVDLLKESPSVTKNESSTKKSIQVKNLSDKRKRANSDLTVPPKFSHDRQPSKKGIKFKVSHFTPTKASSCYRLNISSKLSCPGSKKSKPSSERNVKKSSKKSRIHHNMFPSDNKVMWSKSTCTNSRKKLTTKPKVRKLSVQQKQELYSTRPDLMPDHWSRYSRLRHYILRRTWALELAVSESITKILSLSFIEDDDSLFGNDTNFFTDGNMCMCL